MKIDYFENKKNEIFYITLPKKEQPSFIKKFKNKLEKKSEIEITKLKEKFGFNKHEFNLPDGSKAEIQKNKKNILMIYSPKEKVVKNIKDIVKKTLVIASLVVFSSIATPIIKQSYQRKKSEIEVSLRPEQKKLIEDLIPDNINETDTIENSNNKTNKYINLSEAALTSIQELSDSLGEKFAKYNNLTAHIRPSFVLVNYDNQQNPVSFRIFCDLNANQNISFEYLIDNPELFENLLESKTMSTADIINGLNNFLININLVDLPVTAQKFNINNIENYYTEIIEKVKTNFNETTNEYENEEIYSFKYYYTDGSHMFENEVTIFKSDAESLTGFDPYNLTTLYELYADGNANFVKEYENQFEINNPSVILLSAKNQEKIQSSTLEQ